MEPLGFDVTGWSLADPQLAVGLVGTQRRRGDALAGELPADDEAAAWVREHLGRQDSRHGAELVRLRALLRELFKAVVDSADLPVEALNTINKLAARAPVTLATRYEAGRIMVERTTKANSDALLRADIARSALAVLTQPDRLRLCRAPGCSLFFLTDRPRKQWCSAGCGNRARVARHYARHISP